jgi:hypothetical protein
MLRFVAAYGSSRRCLARQLANIVKAMKAGDVRLFRDEVQRHRVQCAARGTFLVLQKLEVLVFRKFMKRLCVGVACACPPVRGPPCRGDGRAACVVSRQHHDPQELAERAAHRPWGRAGGVGARRRGAHS